MLNAVQKDDKEVIKRQRIASSACPCYEQPETHGTGTDPEAGRLQSDGKMGMKNTIAITAVKGIALPQMLDRGVQIEDTPVPIFLTNDRGVIRNLLGQQLMLAMGTLETTDIVAGGIALYSRFEGGEFPSHEFALDVLTDWLYRIETFFQSLWLIRDNAVDSELGFIEWYHAREGISHSSNFIASRIFNSRGLQSTIEFTLADLKRARAYYQSYLRSISFPNRRKRENDVHPNPFREIISSKDISRLTRANYFLNGARGESDLGVKLSLYMSCLEVLFSTDARELNHKLSERVAIFIGNSPGERISIFSILKRAYDARSRVLHGDALSPKSVRDLGHVSEQVDNVIRRVLVKLFEAPDIASIFEAQESQVLDRYFTELLFVEKSDLSSERLVGPEGSSSTTQLSKCSK